MQGWAQDPNGKDVFNAYNCDGRQFDGGRDTGPAFMDQKQLAARPAQISAAV